MATRIVKIGGLASWLFNTRSAWIWTMVVVVAGTICSGPAIAQTHCNSLLAAEIGRQWGFVDRKGNLIIPATFEFANEFADGRAHVESAGLWGIINEQGEWIMRPNLKYSMLANFDGRILIRESGKVRFLDQDGKPISPAFEDALTFSEGVAAIKTGNKWGYIARTGKIVIPARFDRAGQFVEGKAEVEFGKSSFFINRSGRTLFNVPPDMHIQTFSEGLAVFSLDDTGLYGFIDERGRVVVKSQFQDAGDFSEGLAKVRIDFDWGFINKDGKAVIQPKYRDTEGFREGLASVQVGDKWGYINKTGERAIPAVFDRAFNFRCGIAYVESNGKWGYIDKTGSFIFPPLTTSVE